MYSSVARQSHLFFVVKFGKFPSIYKYGTKRVSDKQNGFVSWNGLFIYSSIVVQCRSFTDHITFYRFFYCRTLTVQPSARADGNTIMISVTHLNTDMVPVGEMRYMANVLIIFLRYPIDRN